MTERIDPTLTAQLTDVTTRPAVTVMDAHCALCARGAAWIARNDHRCQFLIVPMQTPLGQALLEQNGLNPNDPTSWLLLEHGVGHTSTEAIIRTGQMLGGVWRTLSMLRIIPRAWRDAAYRLIARNRYRWFGRGDMCTMPDPDVQKRLFH